jgi:hypothetical protein
MPIITLKSEKNYANMFTDALEYYNTKGLIFGSVELNYKPNKDGIFKKSYFPKTGWTTLDSFCEQDHNGVYIITGNRSNITVIDIDDLTIPEAKQISVLCEDCSNYKIKTKKGLHYYFKYEKDLDATITRKKLGFDMRGNGGMILCPPSNYLNENQKIFKYEFNERPEKDEDINPMSNELKKYIRDILNKPLQDIKKIKQIKMDINKDKNEDFIKLNDKLDDLVMKKLLDNLNIGRAIDYDNWLYVGWCLYNSGYDILYWDYFSKRSGDYNYENNLKYYNKLFNGVANTGELLTVSTLWYWLKKDNSEVFDELQNEILLKKYSEQNMDNILEFDMEKEFSDKKMYDLFISDINFLTFEKYIKIISKTNSFKYFNEYHFYVKQTKSYYLKNKDDFINLEGHLKSQYDKLQILINKKVHHFITYYVRCVDSNVYNNFIFDPSGLNGGEFSFNLFRGFKFEKCNIMVDNAKINIFIEHIKYICNNDEESYEYFIKWFAHIIQKPYEKTDVAIVLYSKTEGVGKNCLTQLFENILEGYYGEFDNTDFECNFNSKFKNKLLMVGNEINARASTASDYLKNIITRTEIIINEKFVSPYKIKDYCNFIFTTNHEIIFKVSDTDRRYMFIKCPDEKKSPEYYKNLIQSINDKNALCMFHKYLKNMNLDNFTTRKPPLTDYKIINMTMSLPAYIKMIGDEPEKYAGLTLSSGFLYKACIEYAKRNNLPHVFSDKFFFSSFKIVFADFYDKKGHCGYIFPKDLEKKVGKIIMDKYILKK